MKSGFTLIELSIVLVVIGLIVGGILTGQDLINAAVVRSQMSQMEKYNTAVHTFQLKYGCLPGDIPNPAASNFGFSPRGSAPGQGDGNGIIQSWNGSLNGTNQEGETILFWNDLSMSGLIEGSYSGTVSINASLSVGSATHPLGNYLPQAKINQGDYITVWSVNGINYFALSSFAGSGYGIASDGGVFASTSAITVKQAYDIDTKMDDGLPQTGSVQAILGGYSWAGDFSSWYGGNGIPGTNTSGWGASSTSCFNNGWAGGTTQQYSVAVSGGTNVNCALTFRFQ